MVVFAAMAVLNQIFASMLKKPVTVRPLMDEYIEELALKAEAFDRNSPEKVNELDAARMDGLDPNETFDSVKLFALCQK